MQLQYSDVTMGAMASQITSLTIVYSTVYLGAGQRKHQSSASLAFVRRIPRWPVNSPHKWPVTRKMFPFDDVIMSASALPSPEVRTFTRDGITSVCVQGERHSRFECLSMKLPHYFNGNVSEYEIGRFIWLWVHAKEIFQIVHVSQKFWSWVV